MWISNRLDRWLVAFASLYVIIPKIVTKDANIVSFTDDTSIIITNSNDVQLTEVINEIFMDINRLKLTCYLKLK
jgi:hypothetical protein